MEVGRACATGPSSREVMVCSRPAAAVGRLLGTNNDSLVADVAHDAHKGLAASSPACTPSCRDCLLEAEAHASPGQAGPPSRLGARRLLTGLVLIVHGQKAALVDRLRTY